ncbi:protocatechuate 3,4-dioxygenase subunit alpha [Nocardioides sp. Kera G14]|uniref:protocatechuate 3,4-dioxygenase subunit alpha n=1 Tax=Nocardioides sp. Kera G14 TaxID=2884264 RepID=UPI001D1052C8|nr:protocatechuate 3,4-dioxygenase subunit alpha [Nocardioides sp. Kera G14]UDY23427.1 protocatechuate 3,4-dioxygenase subunit alpha [Nocardioides sp. Kera G14]
MSFAPTPGQTVGPFFHYGLPYEGDRDLVPAGSPGSVLLHGRVYDGAGNPIPDALVEIWQAAPDGTIPQVAGSIRRDGWTFTGFGRSSSGRDGRYTFSTLTPGPTEEGAAAFFAVTVFARGLLNRLFTRAYLPAEEQPAGALEADALLSALPSDRQATLMTSRDAQGYVFDIRLQGSPDGGAETVFLRYPGQ